MNVVREIQRINERELELGLSETASWHWEYRHSAYIFFGNVDYTLTEGDLLAVFSQCGEVVDLHLVRDKATGKSMGFGFLAFEDARSAVLAIDNFNGYALLGRTLRVDHADKYRRPRGAKKDAAAQGEEDKYKIFAAEEDEEYDERRRRIWDYELYGTQNVAAKPAASGVSSSSRPSGDAPSFEEVAAGVEAQVGGGGGDAESRHADRILRMLQEKQRARQQQRATEEAGGAAHAAAGMRRESTAVTAAPAAASSSSSSHARTSRDARSRSRSRDRNRDRRRDEQRSCSRRERERDRSRSRERQRDRDWDRDRDRERDRDRRRSHSRSRSRDRRR